MGELSRIWSMANPLVWCSSHWTITIIVWLLGVFGIVRWAKKCHVLYDLVDFKYSRSMLIIACGLVLGSALLQFLLSDAQFPQVLFEYRGFESIYPDYALLVIIFQVLYYAVEMLLVFR